METMRRIWTGEVLIGEEVGGGFVERGGVAHGLVLGGVVRSGGVLEPGCCLGGRGQVFGRVHGGGMVCGNAVVRGEVNGVCVSGWAEVDGVLRGYGVVRDGVYGGVCRVGGSLVGGLEADRFRALVELEFGFMEKRWREMVVRWRGVSDAWGWRKLRLRRGDVKERPRLLVREACRLLRHKHGVVLRDITIRRPQSRELGVREIWPLARWWLRWHTERLRGLESRIGCRAAG